MRSQPLTSLSSARCTNPSLSLELLSVKMMIAEAVTLDNAQVSAVKDEARTRTEIETGEVTEVITTEGIAGDERLVNTRSVMTTYMTDNPSFSRHYSFAFLIFKRKRRKLVDNQQSVEVEESRRWEAV
jgi:hypothetical protein